MKHLASSLTFLLILFTGACGGLVAPIADGPDAGPSDAPSASSSSTATTDAPAVPTPPANGASISAEHGLTETDVATARASCSDPHGPVEIYASVDELRVLLEGSWLYCGSRDSGMSESPSSPGAEFTDDGRFYWLETDGRTHGIRRAANPASYAASGNASDEYIVLRIQYDDGHHLSGHAIFETGPRRLILDVPGMPNGYFVPIP